jgi:hypothetical protein
LERLVAGWAARSRALARASSRTAFFAIVIAVGHRSLIAEERRRSEYDG